MTIVLDTMRDQGCFLLGVPIKLLWRLIKQR
jgi:hypothetical protein